MLAIYRRVGDDRSEGQLLFEIGALHFDRRMPRKAMKSLEHALVLLRSTRNIKLAQECSELVLKSEEMKKSLEDALAVARATYARYQSTGNPNDLWLVARHVYDSRTQFGPSRNGPIDGPVKVDAQGGDREEPLPTAKIHQPFDCDWTPAGSSE